MPDRRMTELVQAVAGRSARDSAALADRLAEHAWPRGGDRRDPVAIEWLRRWRPTGMPAAAADCACAVGRCAWCN